MNASVQEWKAKLPGLQDSDLAYLSGLYAQFLSPSASSGLRIGPDFRPSALLSADERRDLLGAVEYSELLEKKEDYARWAQKTILTLNPMNGGIGSSLRREKYLSGLWKELGRTGPVVLGAKGSDLYFEIETGGVRRKISISQAKILRAVRESRFYRELRLEPLGSTETLDSIRALMDHPSPVPGKTYRELVTAQSNMQCRETLLQAALPTVDSDGRLSARRLAPGGHGQWGVHFLLQALEASPLVPSSTEIRAIYNEDGLNNTIDPVLSGWMAKERVPLVMLTTTKTGLDRKGGLLGLARTASGGFRKEMIEKAQADAAGQGELFSEMGLSQGESGAQYFNTNTALFNDSVLVPFLRDLVGFIGREAFIQIISPILIQNRKKQTEAGAAKEYVQLEGALCSVLLNLDGYLSSCDRPEVRAILSRHGFIDGNGRVLFLRVVNVEAGLRTRFFTPVKNAFDYWLQFHSGLFRVNPETWELESVSSAPMPEVQISDEYEDVAFVLDSFARVRVEGLRSLQIRGPVRLGGAPLRGVVRIENRSGTCADFGDPGFRTRAGWPASGVLSLENCAVTVAPDGRVQKSSL
jgi:hypothetical protein